MLVTVKTSDFARPLAVAAQLARSSTMPILSTVLLKAAGEKLWIEATDLEVSLSWGIPAEVEDAGTAALPARALNDLVRRLSAEAVRLFGPPEEVEVGYGSGALKLRGLPPEQFPVFPELPGEAPAVILARQAVEEVLDRLSFAVGEQPPFCGVLFEAQDGASTWVATDSHRLACSAGPELGFTLQALLPLKALEAAAASRADRLEFVFAPQAVQVRAEDLAVHARLINVRFPAWRAVLPKRFEATLAADAKALAATLERALLVARQAQKEAANLVRLDFGPDGLVVKARGEQGSFAERVEIVLEGAPGTVHFNGAYLLDALRPVGGRAVLSFGPEFNTLVVRAEGDPSYSCLVLPVIVNGSEAGA
jgi:DNA polymerase-3 subunit beta